MRGMADRSKPAKQKRHVFTYQTRVCVTPEQDKMLREYAVRFGRVERTLYGDLQKGEAANRLKAEYLVRFAITARQFNATRIQLQGKIEAIRQLLPLQVANLQTRICKAKKIVARLRKRMPGSNRLHQKRRRLAGLEQRWEQLEAERKAGQIHLCFGSKKLFHSQFIGAGAIVTRSVHGIELASVRLNETEAKIEVYMAWRKHEESPAVFSFPGFGTPSL